MAGKRKDKNGRVLKTGENQRKNGTYDYRYTDPHGKVRCVYAKTLESLREKEAAIQRDLADGIELCGRRNERCPHWWIAIWA